VPHPDEDRASPVARHRATPTELREQLETARAEVPFLIYRDGRDLQRVFRLDGAPDRLTVGRRGTSDISLEWDHQVSRVHAELERLGEDWTVRDDGLSSNGTFVNGIRVLGRRRLNDGDEISVGGTILAFRAPARGASGATFVPEPPEAAPYLSNNQRAVLLALARPFRASRGFATPATNKHIAAEVFLTLNGVKSIMRTLFQKFDLEDLPQNQKRARLVERALQTGALSEEDL
jgi:pSer/pThr/pTyr-binding forkhead associated (FHA) protein